MSEVQGQGLVGLTEIESAARRLAGVAVRTPLLPADAFSDAGGAEVRLKCENLQRSGAFKIRGAYNFVSQLSDEQVKRGVITFSSGNHALAMALTGKLRGIRSVVVMPTTAPRIKREGAEALGAEVILEGTTSTERQRRAEAIAESEGMIMVPPFDHRHIIAGQGTVGLEIARDWRDVDFVLAPVGGGGLVSGVAAAVKRMLPKAQVIGVEPAGAASMRAALDHGAPTLLEKTGSIADGLMTMMAGELTFDHVKALVDDVVTVSDDAIREATKLLVTRQKLVVEFSGAATAAALLEQKIDAKGGHVAVVISGGNLDPSQLAHFA
jgi:threonine dehydratase